MTQTFLCLYAASLFLFSAVLYAWMRVPTVQEAARAVSAARTPRG